MLITETNPEKAKQQIRNSSSTNITVQAQSPEFNRTLLEYGKFDQLLFPEPDTIKKQDRIKQLDTGINSIMAKIATKNKVAIAIDLNKITSLQPKQKAQQLARLKEIIKITRKAKTQLKIINYKDTKDAIALLQSLGADSKQVKQATP